MTCRSGTESRIDIAKKVLISFLESLPSGSKFNVMSYGTNHKLLFIESRPVEEENIEEAIKIVSTFQADMCGNDLLRTLKTIFSQKRDLPLCLFLLTDGH